MEIKQLFNEIIHIKERLNEMGQRQSGFSETLHQSSTDQLSAVQDYIIESEYKKTLEEFRIEEV